MAFHTNDGCACTPIDWPSTDSFGSVQEEWEVQMHFPPGKRVL